MVKKNMFKKVKKQNWLKKNKIYWSHIYLSIYLSIYLHNLNNTNIILKSKM